MCACVCNHVCTRECCVCLCVPECPCVYACVPSRVFICVYLTSVCILMRVPCVSCVSPCVARAQVLAGNTVAGRPLFWGHQGQRGGKAGRPVGACWGPQGFSKTRSLFLWLRPGPGCDSPSLHCLTWVRGWGELMQPARLGSTTGRGKACLACTLLWLDPPLPSFHPVLVFDHQAPSWGQSVPRPPHGPLHPPVTQGPQQSSHLVLGGGQWRANPQRPNGIQACRKPTWTPPRHTACRLPVHSCPAANPEPRVAGLAGC